jgi:hypothetical protein
MEVCRAGYRVQFWTAADLVNTLVEAREERQLKRTLIRLQRFDLIIIVGFSRNPLLRRPCFRAAPPSSSARVCAAEERA